MLSMKTLKVAIVTMGSALLLGPGLAAAVDIQLDGTGANAASPVTYATETLPMAVEGTYLVAYPGDNLDLHVKPRRRIEATEDVFIRLELSGVTIGGEPQLIASTLDADGDLDNTVADTGVGVSSGGAMSNFVVFPVGAVALGSTVGVRLATNGMLGANSGTFSATISSYSDPDDALDGEFATSAFGGSATVIRLATGVMTTFKPAVPAPTASVNTGFIKFKGETPGQAILGWLGVQENIATTAGLHNAEDGAALADNDVIAEDGMISFNVMGNLDIGAFHVLDEVFMNANGDIVQPGTEGAMASVDCPSVAAEMVDRGTLVDAEGMMLVGEMGELPTGAESGASGDMTEGIKVLCVNVDVTGPDSNMTAIPKAAYTATAHVKRNATADAVMVGEGDVGSIRRDGASVEIAYLTTSEKHNQRLIVVNRGTRPITITGIEFQAEHGTDVELSALAMAAAGTDAAMIPGGTTRVIRMGGDLGMLNITGDSRRTAATLSFNGVKDDISVATTQVNLSDSSTDTVMWEVK